MPARNATTPTRDIRAGVHNFGLILAKYWRAVVAVGIVGLLLGLVTAAQTTAQYESTTTLYISVRASGSEGTGDLLQGSNFAQSAMPSYTDVVTTALVLDQVADEADADLQPEQLQSMLSVSSPSESVLLEITATHENPEVAADIANITAEVFTEVVENQLEASNSAQASPVRVRTVDAAVASSQQLGSPFIRNSIIGLFAGLLLGGGLAALRDQFDTRVHSTKDLEHITGLPVLGRIPEDEHINARPLIIHEGASPARAEAVRMLRTNLQFLGSAEGPETYVVTSAMPSAGKSHVVANLALALAESGARVSLIDADLRNPRLAHIMGLEGAAGLSDVLIGRVGLHDVLQPWRTENFHVLPAGQLPPNPSELLGSQAMLDVVRELEAVSDYVLIDTPPVLPVTDAAVASTLATGTLLVVAIDQTKWADAVQALETLDAVDSRLLGFVTNREQTLASATHGYTAANYGKSSERNWGRKLRVRS